MSNDPTSKTAYDLVTGALRLIGQYAPGETVSPDDANDALNMLNGLFDVLSNESLSVFNNNENVITLTPGKQSYTVGSGGDISIQRPLRITQAYTRVTSSGGSVDFQCDIKETSAYTSIGLKSQPGPWPKILYYNTSFPLAQLYMWPVPTAGYEFHFWTDMLLQSVSLTTQLSLPQGYFLFLQYALAELLGPMFGVQISPDIAKQVLRMKRAIKMNNSTPQRQAAIDAAIGGSGGKNAGFILTGGF